MKESIVPDRVVLVRNPPEDKKFLRGPVEIWYKGKLLGLGEINHGMSNINKCSSLVIYEGKFVEARYELTDIDGLKPSDLPYLIFLGNGLFRFKKLHTPLKGGNTKKS